MASQLDLNEHSGLEDNGLIPPHLRQGWGLADNSSAVTSASDPHKVIFQKLFPCRIYTEGFMRAEEKRRDLGHQRRENFTRNAGPKAQEEKKASLPAARPVGPRVPSTMNPSPWVFKSFILYKYGAKFCSHVFIRMLRVEFCLRYTLASQLLIKTCCLWYAASPAIHLFTSFLFISHSVLLQKQWQIYI